MLHDRFININMKYSHYLKYQWDIQDLNEYVVMEIHSNFDSMSIFRGVMMFLSYVTGLKRVIFIKNRDRAVIQLAT